ncbi:MAG: hypothetical protein Q7U72_01855 [Brevundimonas sp.]|jgi:hypothetical protein|uniref:hypothetical protein n=1 Tax=Brevundimonas sp. TaxID=1871086 RepID=UPI00271F955F|nr:hypothetical protein [Brevundimonas sp.]MDO9076174.1 hypothetical protein [Brevundimonas sp.]MDP3081952.1 hypothetical protein [Brevundimonas sp.]MDZ4062615.1 hypothetical protein [Brevundimonas sp.]
MSRTTIMTIRRDKARRERDAFDRLRAELTQAFAAPENSYASLTAAEVIARNQWQARQ